MQLSRSQSRGFSLPELLVAGAMSAAFFVAAALSYQAITYNRDHYQGLVSLTIDPTGDLSGAVGNFYSNLAGQTFLNAYGAPSYGRAAAAQQVYDRFWEDMEKASAAFCLSRNGKLNAIRPTSLTFPAGTLGNEIDSQSAFLLTILGTPGTNIYTDFRNVSPLSVTVGAGHLGGSVYILQPLNVADQLGVRAVYEIDLLEISAPSGVYASVRRYVGTDLSDYYDVFYSEASVSDFGPLFVAFEKSSRLVFPETGTDTHGVTLDSYKVAPRSPFFMMWWPDPAFILGKDGKDLDGVTVPTGDVKTAYNTMCARTGIMAVVPFFPSL